MPPGAPLRFGFRSPGRRPRVADATRPHQDHHRSGEAQRMCGIVGYVGPRQARPLLLAGLEKLEYRGYDSAGISVLRDGHIDSVRAVGNLSHLRAAIAARGGADAPTAEASVAVADPPATGIGHTRWATH